MDLIHPPKLCAALLSALKRRAPADMSQSGLGVRAISGLLAAAGLRAAWSGKAASNSALRDPWLGFGDGSRVVCGSVHVVSSGGGCVAGSQPGGTPEGSRGSGVGSLPGGGPAGSRGAEAAPLGAAVHLRSEDLKQKAGLGRISRQYAVRSQVRG